MEIENTIQRKSLSEVHSSIDATNRKGWRKALAFMGPAYLVSVGYMDPGNWATDIAGGSRFGYALIWVLLMSNLMALLLQSLSARLGVVLALLAQWVHDPAELVREPRERLALLPLRTALGLDSFGEFRRGDVDRVDRERRHLDLRVQRPT